MAIDVSIKVDNGVSNRVDDDVGALIANTDKNFERFRDDRLGNAVDPASTTFAVLLC